jgi:hypothetical protein
VVVQPAAAEASDWWALRDLMAREQRGRVGRRQR